MESLEPQWAKQLPESLLENCKVLPNREAILSRLPRGLSFCEIGVGLGDFTKKIIDTCDVKSFYALDIFVLHTVPEVWGGRVGRTLQGKDHLQFYQDSFAAEIAKGLFHILKGDSLVGLASVPDGEVDVFYVDANHSYPSVTKELSAILRIMKNDSIIIMNDYIMADWLTNTKYGVVQATNEFMVSHDMEMIYFAFEGGMFCDVAIRRRGLA